MELRFPAYLLSTALLASSLAGAGCAPTYATYGYDTGVAAPPPLYSPAPQDLVVLPGTNVYAAPSFSAGLYFSDGYWWRPWNGRWYRTSRYGSDWRYFAGTPSFYRSIPRDWRTDYYRHQWRGRPYDYHRVSREEAVANWDRWKRDDRWSWDRRRDDHDHDRDRRDRGDRYRYDDSDFRREPVRYEYERDRDRSRSDDNDRRHDVSREADHRWERRSRESGSREESAVIIRRTGTQPAVTRPVPAPSGRGVRRGHDRDGGQESPDSGYVDWRQRRQ